MTAPPDAEPDQSDDRPAEAPDGGTAAEPAESRLRESRLRESRLRPAAENPWYVLATLWGEQGDGFDPDLHAKNRRAWNRWVAQALTPEAVQGLIDEGADPDDFTPLSAEEQAELQARAAARGQTLPDPGTPDTPASIDFRDTLFAWNFSADQFVWPGTARFAGATFRDWATFAGASFRDMARFDGASFRGGARFDGASFRGGARFDGATFRGGARFDGATFRGGARFDGATFRGGARFAGATFRGGARFAGASFRGRARFAGASFRGGADFQRGAFESRTDFARAKFKGDVPDFRDRSFAHATDWRRVQWPPAPKQVEPAEEAEERYAALRHAMEEAGRYEHARSFFARELACRRVHAGWPTRLAVDAYVLLSDVGRSVVRPLGVWTLALLSVWVVQFEMLHPENVPAVWPEPRNLAFDTFSMALGGAVVVGSPVFDPRRGNALEAELGAALFADYGCGTAAPAPVCAEVAAANGDGSFAPQPRAIPDALKAVQFAHAAFSALCLFLAGLGLRNWLRIR